MEIVGYHSRIKITQVLPCVNDDITIDPEIKCNKLMRTSWLYDPFGDNLTYGVEFNVNKGFSWDFFIYTKTAEMAEELGEALLMNLQEKYKGLDGKVSVYPLYSKYLEVDRRLYEIILPSLPPIKLQFLRKIINYYKTPQRKIDANIFILWKRDDLRLNPDPFNYMLRIFISLNPNQNYSMNFDKQESSINAVLRYFISDMSIPPYIKAEYKSLSPINWIALLTCNVFPKRSDYELGGGKNVPVEFLPNYIRPNKIDFDIPHEMPLLNPPILENRNSNNMPISKNDPNFIYIGKKMKDGVLSTDLGLIEIDGLTTHLNIFGKTGTGKSTLIKMILNDLHNKRPDVGILILNLAKPYLEDDYPMAHVYKFPSEKFRVPYIILFDRAMISIKETSNVFAACLGLKHMGPGIFSETFQICYSEHKRFPKEVREFFSCVDECMKAKAWEPEYKQHIRTAFQRRISEMFYRPDLEATLNLFEGESSSIPEWFIKWKEGETVLLDLTKCLEDEQHLIGMLILNMIEVLIPIDKEKTNKLKHLIAMDEAHRILGKSNDKHPESPEFIMKNRTNAHFSRNFNEWRAKGIGIITADQHPHLLLDVAIDSARNKILFQLGYPANQIFTGNMREREMLLTLWERYALVITNAERYLMKTADDNI